MSVEHVQTKKEIQATLAAAGMSPRKRFGQHFLIDGNLMRRLVESAEIEVDDVVLEVGGGTGGLTDLLVRRAGCVVCVEIDRDLQTILAERFADVSGFTLLRGDVLHGKHHLAPAAAELLGGADATAEGPSAKLVANLPYQVATPLVMDLLIDYPRVRRLCFTVQAEVGERILSPPGRKSYGPLSIVSELLAECRIVARIPAHVFWPRPIVESVMIRMDARETIPFANRRELHRFVSFVRVVFEHRRKTLRSALRHAFPDRAPAQSESTVAAELYDRRPEEITVDEWLRLFSGSG